MLGRRPLWSRASRRRAMVRVLSFTGSTRLPGRRWDGNREAPLEPYEGGGPFAKHSRRGTPREQPERIDTVLVSNPAYFMDFVTSRVASSKLC